MAAARGPAPLDVSPMAVAVLAGLCLSSLAFVASAGSVFACPTSVSTCADSASVGFWTSTAEAGYTVQL